MADTDALSETKLAFVELFFADVSELTKAGAAAKNLRLSLHGQGGERLDAVLAAAEYTALAGFALLRARVLHAA